MKPLFFDVAWNYIEYPGSVIGEKAAVARRQSVVSAVDGRQDGAAQQKKGWFGFGR